MILFHDANVHKRFLDTICQYVCRSPAVVKNLIKWSLRSSIIFLKYCAHASLNRGICPSRYCGSWTSFCWRSVTIQIRWMIFAGNLVMRWKKKRDKKFAFFEVLCIMERIRFLFIFYLQMLTPSSIPIPDIITKNISTINWWFSTKGNELWYWLFFNAILAYEKDWWHRDNILKQINNEEAKNRLKAQIETNWNKLKQIYSMIYQTVYNFRNYKKNDDNYQNL